MAGILKGEGVLEVLNWAADTFDHLHALVKNAGGREVEGSEVAGVSVNSSSFMAGIKDTVHEWITGKSLDVKEARVQEPQIGNVGATDKQTVHDFHPSELGHLSPSPLPTIAMNIGRGAGGNAIG